MQSAGNKGQQHIPLVPTERTRNCSCDSVPVWCLLSWTLCMMQSVPALFLVHFTFPSTPIQLRWQWIMRQSQSMLHALTPTHTDRTSRVAAAPSHTALGSATRASGKYGDLHNLLWMLTSTHVLNLKTKLKWIRGKSLKDNGFFKSHLQQLLWTLTLI